MPAGHSDHNLLLGVLALQMDFIGRDALIGAMHAWVLEKARPLGELLVQQGALQADQRDLLERLVQAHLEMHGHDVEQSLAALSLSHGIRQDLHSLGDGDMQASLARLPTPSGPAEPAALPSTTAEKPGTLGLRYRILRPHDKGGIGEVFVALDQELNRQVALKEILDRHAGDPVSRGRFVREAEITGGLEHPGIVPVYGLGQYADGRPFYAMRFIQGETLKDAIARHHRGSPGASWPAGTNTRTPPRSVELERRALLTRIVAVCNTIAYAHSRGVIHRDLKPSNIMLGKYGETLVVDWGMAKALAQEDRRAGGGAEQRAEPALVPRLADGIETLAGAALGTAAYMSPEQAAGRLDLLGPASDIYSLGATLYTLLTGRPPIEGKDTAEILRKAQRGEWLPPRQIKPDVPPALDAICRKAMAQAPPERYVTALDLAADVERWLADEPVAAYREPWAVRCRRWARRHMVLVGTAAGALVVALVGAMVALVLVNDARDREAVARQRAEDKEQEARQQKEEARFNQYVAQMNLVQREYEASHISRVRELLEAQVPREAGATDWRDFEWYYWQRVAHQEVLTLKGPTRLVRQVHFSPDGRRLIAVSEDQTVQVWDTAAGEELFTLKGYAGWTHALAAFSPDGGRVALVSPDRAVRVVDTATGKELLILKGHTGWVDRVAFSPDGRRLALGGGGWPVRFYDAGTGKELFTLKGHTGPVNGLAFSPDGRRIVLVGVGRMVRVYDAGTGKELVTLKGHTGQVSGVAFSPDGGRLASASADQTVRVWDTATGTELLTLKGHTGEFFRSVAFSPDGRRLASGSQDGTVRVWDAATGQETLTIKGQAGSVSRVAFSPDGRRLASMGLDPRVRIWDAATGKELVTLPTGPVIRGVAFSADWQGLASGGADGTVRVWDPANNREMLTLGRTTRGPGLLGVAFSPDGRRLGSAGGDTVRVWDAATGQELLTLTGHASRRTVDEDGRPLPPGSLSISGTSGMAFSPDGRRLGSAGGDDTVRVWDATTGEKLLTLKGHTSRVRAIAFSPDGRRLASAGRDQTVRIWDAASGHELLVLKGQVASIACVAFSPEGRRLAFTNGDHTVRLWDAATGKELLTLAGHTDLVLGVAFSPDGRRLASAGRDQTVRIWDATTGKELRILKGHTSPVSHVAFSPNGRRLASGSWDQTVGVWDVATGQELLTLKGHTNSVRGVAFSPDGRRLASAGTDGTVRVWEASPVPEAVWRQRQLVSRVTSLFGELALREEVLAALRKDPALGEADREFALQVAQTSSEDPRQLNGAAWKVVKAHDAGKDAYALARRQAEAAVRLDPGNEAMLNTLGVAQYRTGLYPEALATLTKSEKLNAARGGSQPADLAFLAMTRQRLGQAAEAKAALARLRELLKQRWAENAEAAAFLHEAEGLIEGKAADKGP
jgi:WD40 repeat protein/serine/threonine protein kinase